MVVLIPRCIVKALQDDISSKTCILYLPHPGLCIRTATIPNLGRVLIICLNCPHLGFAPKCRNHRNFANFLGFFRNYPKFTATDRNFAKQISSFGENPTPNSGC